eukprot:IDg1404t1
MASNAPGDVGDDRADTPPIRLSGDERGAPVAPVQLVVPPVTPAIDADTLARYWAEFQSAHATQGWPPSVPSLGVPRWVPARDGLDARFCARRGFPAMGQPMMCPFGMMYPGVPLPGYGTPAPVVAPASNSPAGVSPAGVAVPARVDDRQALAGPGDPPVRAGVTEGGVQPKALDLSPYVDVVRPTVQRGRTRPEGWHLIEQTCPERHRGDFGYRVPRYHEYSLDWNLVPGTEPFYVPYEDIRKDPDARKIGGEWFFAPAWFKDLKPMREAGFTLFAFGPWFSDAAVEDCESLRDYRLADGGYPGECGLLRRLLNRTTSRRMLVSDMPTFGMPVAIRWSTCAVFSRTLLCGRLPATGL